MDKSVICIFWAFVLCASSNAQVNTAKHHIGCSNGFFVGVSTVMSPMADFLEANGEAYRNLTMGRVGFSLEADVFLIDNLAYHIKLSPYAGRELEEIRNNEVSALGINSVIGLEYYFRCGDNSLLSLGVGVGGDIFGYFYKNHSARYDNYTIPVSVTFWHKRIGYSLSYEPCVSKGTPRNNVSGMPEIAPNYVSFSVRFK